MTGLLSLRCVLQHWYELRPKGERIGSENNKRLTHIKQLHTVYRRQKADALRGSILAAARSERPLEPAFLPVGAGLFPEHVLIETLVRRSLTHQREDYRIAAFYAASFFLYRSDAIGLVLTEMVMLGKGVEQQAASDALRLAGEAPCASCRSKTAAAESWCPVRSS